MLRFISVISEDRFLQDGRSCMSSSVKTDWNCSRHALAFAQSDIAGKPKLVLRAVMPVSSLCKALIYDKRILVYHSGSKQLLQKYVSTLTLANILFIA